MAKKIAAPRGTRDLLPPDTRAWDHIETVARDLSRRYAFERIDIPLFERVELFARGLGESSDAVEKEMFRVGGASGSEEERSEWALRPEPTAGIVRAYIEHGMHVRPGPLRLYLMRFAVLGCSSEPTRIHLGMCLARSWRGGVRKATRFIAGIWPARSEPMNV